MQDSIELQRDLDSLVIWTKQWGMRFNATKCQALRVSQAKRPIERFYTINDHILEQTQSTKYLGVHISGNMEWDTHIDSISAKANRTLGFLRRNLAHCPKELKELSYFSLVHSVLEYACQVWDPHLRKDIDRLEMIQRRAARFTSQDYSTYSSVSAMLKALGWLPLTIRRQNHRLTLMFQITNDLVAIPTDGIITHADSRTRASHHQKFKQIS